MIFWKKKNASGVQQLSVDGVTFLFEQDGVPEQELKTKLVKLFGDNNGLSEAFLVRVRYRSGTEAVTLCLVAERTDKMLVMDAAAEFKKLFSTDASLDIMFLTSVQRREISHVATPFYRRASQ